MPSMPTDMIMSAISTSISEKPLCGLEILFIIEWFPCESRARSADVVDNGLHIGHFP